MVDKSDPNLVAWYRCESVGSNVFDDEMGTYDGTLSGVSLISGGSFSDGVSAFVCSAEEIRPIAVTPTGDLLLTSTSPFGISLWVKVTNYPTSGNESCLIVMRSASLRGIGLELTSANYSAQLRDDSIIDTAQYAHNSATDWVHLCFSGNGTTVYLYVDGVLVSSDPIGSSTATLTDINIGGNRLISGTPVPYDGLVDDVRIFNRFLTEADAKYIMHGRGYA